MLRRGALTIGELQIEIPFPLVVAGDATAELHREDEAFHLQLEALDGVTDAHAHGVQAEDEPTYDVRFRSDDLWRDSSDDALVHVGVFQSYLERVG